MRYQLFHSAAALLGRAASAADALVGGLHSLQDLCVKAAGPGRHAVECPYCQEHIRSVEDHVTWCDLPDSLRPALKDEHTPWPVSRYGVQINREWAVALTRSKEKNP